MVEFKRFPHFTMQERIKKNKMIDAMKKISKRQKAKALDSCPNIYDYLFISVGFLILERVGLR